MTLNDQSLERPFVLAVGKPATAEFKLQISHSEIRIREGIRVEISIEKVLNAIDRNQQMELYVPGGLLIDASAGNLFVAIPCVNPGGDCRGSPERAPQFFLPTDAVLLGIDDGSSSASSGGDDEDMTAKVLLYAGVALGAVCAFLCLWVLWMKLKQWRRMNEHFANPRYQHTSIQKTRDSLGGAGGGPPSVTGQFPGFGFWASRRGSDGGFTAGVKSGKVSPAMDPKTKSNVYDDAFKTAAEKLREEGAAGEDGEDPRGSYRQGTGAYREYRKSAEHWQKAGRAAKTANAFKSGERGRRHSADDGTTPASREGNFQRRGTTDGAQSARDDPFSPRGSADGSKRRERGRSSKTGPAQEPRSSSMPPPGAAAGAEQKRQRRASTGSQQEETKKSAAGPTLQHSENPETRKHTQEIEKLLRDKMEANADEKKKVLRGLVFCSATKWKPTRTRSRRKR